MPETKQPMTCPCCGAKMNCHAEKVTEPTCAEDVKHTDPVLGGVVQQVHTCPKCGATESRRVN